MQNFGSPNGPSNSAGNLHTGNTGGPKGPSPNPNKPSTSYGEPISKKSKRILSDSYSAAASRKSRAKKKQKIEDSKSSEEKYRDRYKMVVKDLVAKFRKIEKHNEKNEYDKMKQKERRDQRNSEQIIYENKRDSILRKIRKLTNSVEKNKDAQEASNKRVDNWLAKDGNKERKREIVRKSYYKKKIMDLAAINNEVLSEAELKKRIDIYEQNYKNRKEND